jgi:AraC-like DNA-binding protein
MLQIDPPLLRALSCLEVRDPREMALDSRLSARLPFGETPNTYRLRDARLWRGRPGPVLTRLAARPLGADLLVAANADRHGTEVAINGLMARHCLALMVAGEARLGQGTTQVALGGARGAVYRGEPGTRLDTGDASQRLNLWVSDAALGRTLVGLLGEPPPAGAPPLRFAPGLNWSTGGGAALLRLFALVLDELRDPDGAAGSPAALARLTDLVAETMLRRLPHSHSEALARAARLDPAAPRHLRRAEAFMAEHADAPLALAEVAAAAGCSLRTLHDAFRRFRDTTPHAALQAIRLERARAALRAEPDAPVGAVARRFGFSHATRFAAAYARRFGETPAETRRRR